MTMSNQQGRAYITTPEAAELSGLTKNYLTLLLRNGRLEGFRVGQAREWFIYTDSLETFLASKRKSGPKGPRKKRQQKPADRSDQSPTFIEGLP
jgi:excisionase family DNA binding protein